MLLHDSPVDAWRWLSHILRPGFWSAYPSFFYFFLKKFIVSRPFIILLPSTRLFQLVNITLKMQCPGWNTILQVWSNLQGVLWDYYLTCPSHQPSIMLVQITLLVLAARSHHWLRLHLLSTKALGLFHVRSLSQGSLHSQEHDWIHGSAALLILPTIPRKPRIKNIPGSPHVWQTPGISAIFIVEEEEKKERVNF